MCRLLCSRCSIMVHWVQVISVPISLGSRTRRTTCTNLQLLNILYVSRSYASPSCSHSVRPCNDNKQTSVWQQARYERVYRRYISGYIPRDDKEIFPGGPPPPRCVATSLSENLKTGTNPCIRPTRRSPDPNRPTRVTWGILSRISGGMSPGVDLQYEHARMRQSATIVATDLYNCIIQATAENFTLLFQQTF